MGQVAITLLAKSPRDIVVPAIALYELNVGIAKSKSPEKKRQQMATFMTHIAVLPFGAQEAEVAAGIRAELETLGTPIGPYDLLIAGIAVSANAVLVTHNTREFGRVEGLRIEDWF